jgi:hypothetical protein
MDKVKDLARQGRAAVGPRDALPRCRRRRSANARNNPEKAVPRKERKAAAAEAACEVLSA